MLALLRRLHLAFQAWTINRLRIRQAVKAYLSLHAQELSVTPLQNLPLVRAQQAAEIRLVKAGKLDSIVDRKSWAFPYLPSSVQRLSMPVAKSTPYNLRRFSRTPVARRAINLIKNSVTAQAWDVRPIEGVPVEDEEEQKARIKVAKKIFTHPNNVDSNQSWVEMGVEDMCIMGVFASEIKLTLDPERPVKLWAMDASTVRIFVSWSESTTDLPHYAQMTGLQGERGAILFYDDEIMYIKDNPATDNPFGLGKLEVAFQQLNDLLGVQRMAGMAGADQVHKCFPGDTEVLTRRGWIPWRDVGDAEEFATRSSDGKLQWQRALGFVREQHDGDLIRFRNRELTITVTPNHRMYGQRFTKDWRTGKQIAGPAGFVEARELLDEVARRPGKGWRGRAKHAPSLYDFRIPTRTEWTDGVLPAPVCRIGARTFAWEDWAAFLGIWFAEGSCMRSNGADKPRHGEYRVQIAQSLKTNPAKYAKIKRLLKRMGFSYVAKPDRFLFSDRDVWAYLVGLGDSLTKSVPQWLKDAPTPVIRAFFDWAMLGDGTVRGRKRTYYTASKRLADDMQELFQKIGSSAAVQPYIDGKSQMYAVEEMLRSDISIIPAGCRGKERMPQRIPYSGMVYCATVPNGTLYCRENGYAFWSGNTWLWWEQPQCFSDDTDVLTKRGWIKWEDAREDDLFATRNAHGVFEWQRASRLYRKRYVGDMIEFNNRNLSVCVTPNHRMYGRFAYQYRQGGKYQLDFTPEGLVQADDICARVVARPGKGRRKGDSTKAPSRTPFDFRIPVRSEWVGSLPSATFNLGAHQFDWHDWAAFLGIWVAEGWSSGSTVEPAGRVYCRVGIAQSKSAHPDVYRDIEGLLQKMGLRFAKTDRGFTIDDEDLWTHLSPLGNKYSKYVPGYMKNAPVSVIRTFIDWAVKGDGWSTHGEGRRRGYFTVSRRLADDMQELFQKSGTAASIYERPAGYMKLPGGRCSLCERGYTLQELDDAEVSLIPGITRPGRNNGIPRHVAYDGVVYCATVPNHTLYCRRNGRPFWSGNSDAAYQIVRRHIQNELEGQAKVSIIGGMKKPEVIEVNPVMEADLLLNWQEMLIRMVANAFDMTAMALGVEHDVNRAVGEVLKDQDFRSAVVPMAKRLQEGFTRKILHEALGWVDLEFAYLQLDDPDLETKTDMNAKMYSANALTPNEWRKSVGKQPLKTPFADMTQFEAMMLNQELMAQLQNRAQEQQQAQQQPAMPAAPGMPPAMPGGPGRGAGGASSYAPRISQGQISRGGQIMSPKPMALPKFPIAGSKWNAREIAKMPVNDLADRIDGGQLPEPQKLLPQMEQQEPNILDQMNDEVKEYFKHVLQEDEDEKNEATPDEYLQMWLKKLRKRAKKRDARSDDMTEYLQNVNQKWRMAQPSKPGAKTYRAVKNPGKPGTPPAARSL